MPEEYRAEHLAELGLVESGPSRVIQAGYKLLGLQTFFTAGPQESRAWTFPAGAKAPQAAGEIHTDFERGFIRAETIAYDDYVALGGESGAREAGNLRQAGKEYLVQDGDLMLFTFNVREHQSTGPLPPSPFVFPQLRAAALPFPAHPFPARLSNSVLRSPFSTP